MSFYSKKDAEVVGALYEAFKGVRISRTKCLCNTNADSSGVRVECGKKAVVVAKGQGYCEEHSPFRKFAGRTLKDLGVEV